MGRRTVNQEFALSALVLDVFTYGIFQELDSDFHGHNRAFPYVFLDHVPEFTSFPLLLCSQEIAGGEVREAVVSNEVCTLRTLSCAWAAENE